MFSSSFHAKSNNNSEQKNHSTLVPRQKTSFLKLVRGNKTHSQTQTQGGKKNESER